MRVLFNHGLTIQELYTNTPKKIIDRKWRWFVARGGSRNSYEDVISDPFKFCINLVINRVIDERVRFKIPTIGESYLDFEIVNEDKFEEHRQYGRFQEIDFINSDFTGYTIRYFINTKGCRRSFQLYLGGELKEKFLNKINEGIKFYSTKDITIHDVIDEVYEKFPHLEKKEVKALLLHGMRRMDVAMRRGCGITISTSKYGNCYFFIGALYSDPIRQVKNYVIKKDKKLRQLYKWSENKYDGYYYIGLSKGAFESWAEENKKNKVRVRFQNIIIRKIMEEIFARNREVYIFRIKIKKDKGWSHKIEKITSRDVTYMGKTIDWKFTPSEISWKELIKIYEAGTN
jgi:hypothetical protein